MECPTPCVCGQIVDLHGMVSINGTLPNGGNLVCVDCICDSCGGECTCSACYGSAACDQCGQPCTSCEAGRCRACGGLGYVVKRDDDDEADSSPVEWREDFDDDDNSVWEADSPYHDEGSHFRWRLKQRLADNRIEWYADHDAELGGDCDGVTWPSIEAAKADVQKAHDHFLRSAY